MEILEPRILLSADGLSPGAGVENHDEDLFDSALHHAAAAVEIVEMKGDSEAHQSDLKYQPEKEAGNLFDGGDDSEIEVVVDGDEGQTDTGGEEPESGTETVDLKPMAVHEIQFETHNFRDERRLEPLVEGDQALEELTATLNIANAPPKAGGIQEASLRIGDGLLEKVENQLVLEEGQTLYGMGLLRGSLVNRGGVVKPGFSPGVISVTDFVQDEAGSTLIEIGGLTPGNGAGHHDQIQASGNAIFGGQLSIDVIDGFEPAEGDTFTIFTWDGSRAGEFDGYLGTSGFAADEGLYFLPVYGANQLDLVVVHNTTVDPAQQTAILDLLNQFANVGDLLDAYDALNQAVDALKDAQAAAASVANTIGDILDNGKVIRDVIRNTIDTIFDEATAKAQSAITTALNNLNGMTVAGYTITMNSVTLTGGGTSSDPFHWDVDMIAARAFSANINEGTSPAFGVAFTTQAAITGSSTFALDFRFGYDAAAKGGAFVELDSFNAGLTVNATGINATVSLPGAPGAPTLNVVGGTMALNASVAIAPKSGVLTSGALTSAAMSSIAGGTTNLSSGFSITPSGTVNANLPLTGSIGGGGASFTMTGLTAKIESADLFGSVPQMSVDSSNLALGASGTFSGKNLTGTFSATTSGGVTEIEANITNFLIEAGSTRILEGSGSGVFRISTTGNDIAGVASLTVSQGPDIPNLTLGGTFEIRFNTGAAPVATIGSTTVNLPAGKYLRVEGTGTLTLSGSGGGPGGTVGGTFTFEETTSNVVYLGITDLNVSLKAGSTNLVSVTGGSGDFVFKEDGPNTGWAGQATATVAISIPGFSNVAGTFGFKVNTLPGAVNESFTAGGSARNVNLPAGPYLRVEGTGVTLDLTVSGIAYAASGNFAFEQSEVDGSDVVLVGVTNFATALSDGTNNLVSVTNGTGGFYSTAAGFAADIAATVAFKPSVSITASGSFVVQVNTLTSAVDKSITVNGAPVTIDLPAGPYLRVAGQGVTLNITVGGVAQSLTGDFNFERGQVNGDTVVKVGATNVSARVSISPAIYVEVTGAEGAFLINNNGIAGEATASGVNVVGVPGLTASATSLKVRVNNTGADVASTTITTSADTSKSYTFSFSGAEFQNFWEISGAASLGITVTTGLGSAGFEMSGTFGFRNAMISGQPKITVGVSGLAIDFKVGTYTAASLNNGNGIFLIDATGIAGKADMNFAVGLVGLSGAVKLEVNTTGTDFSAAPVAITVGTISGTLDVMGGDDFIRACITGSANLQLGSINIPIAAGFTVTKNLSNGEIEFRNKTTDALLLRVDSAGELHHGFTIPDFTKPDPAEILSFLRQLANWLDVFRGSDIFQLKIPFTDSTVGDALDWTTAFVDNIYSHLTEFRLLPDSAISFGGGINLGGTFKVNFSNDASDQYEITIPALVAGNATSARNIINNALNGTALNGGGNIGDWLEAALDDAGNLYLKLTRDRSISSSFFQLADAGPLSGLNLRDAQGMIEQSLHQTVEALIDAIGDALGLPAASRPQYDEEARMIVWPVDWTYNYSDSLNLNFDESLGPIAGASIEGQVDLSVELRLQFQFGFDWGASEVPRLISNTQTPVPTDGRLSEDAHFALYLNNHPEDGNPADFNFTLPVGVTAGNNSIDDLAADINALFVGQFWEGIPLDKLLYAQKAGSGLAISVVNEADADGDGTLDLADEDANGNGVLDAGEDLDLDGNLDIDEDLNNDGIRQEYLGIVNLLAAVANQDDPFSTEMGFGAEISNALGEVDADDSGEPDNDGAYFRTVSIMGKRGLFIDGLVSGQPAILEASLTIDTPTPIHGELSFGFVEVEGDLVFRTGDAAGTLNPLAVALTLKNQTTGLTRFYLADLYTGSDSAEITNIINGPTFSGSFYAAIENIQVTAGIVIPFRGDPKISIWIPDINHLEYNAEPYDPVNNNEGIFLEYPDLDELLSFQGFGFAKIVRALNSIVDTLKELDGFGFLDENLPFIDMSVSDLVDYAAKFAELIDAVASGNSGSIQDMLVEMEDQLEALFGIPDDNLHVGLESVATAVLDGGSAVAEYNPAGSNNGVTITGAGALAGSTIYFYNDDALGGNTATATWDAVDQLLSIAVNNGETDANAIIAALGSIPQWAGALIADDNTGGTNTGAGPVEVKNAIKFSLTFSAGYANSLPLNINLKDLVGFIAGDASPYAGFLDAATNFISVEASGVLTVNASANLTLDFGIDLSDSSDIKPFLYDSTGVELFARVLGTDLNFEASLGSLVGIWVRDGHVAIDGDGDPDTKPEDGDDGVRFRLGLKDNNGDGRHYFNESFFNLDNIDISAEGGIQAVLPIYMPLETIPLDGEDDANGDGWPDNYLVVDIPDIVRLFLDDAAEGGTAEIEMRDANNDVAINGPSPDFKVSLRQDGAVNNGATAAWSSGANTLTININSGQTSANSVVTAVNGVSGFSAALTPNDPAGNTGAGKWQKITIITPDFSQAISGIDLCDLLDHGAPLLVDGLDKLLGTIQEGMEEVALSDSLPLIGDGLKDVASFIEDFREGLLADLKAALTSSGGVTALIEQAIKTALWDTLGPGGINLLVNPDGSALDLDLGSSQLAVSVDCNDGLLVDIRLKKALDLVDTTDNPIDFDIGVPGFGLDVEGNVQIQLSFDLKIRFGLNKEDGFFFLTSGGHDWEDTNGNLVKDSDEVTAIGAGDPELFIGFEITIPGLSAAGELLFLELKASDDPDDPSSFVGSFAVDLTDPNNDGKLTWAEMTSPGLKFTDVVDPRLGATADVNLDLAASFGGSTAFPRILAEFHLDWTADLENGVGTPVIEFGNVQLDVGSFIADFLAPILTEIRKVTEPLDPIIDIVTARLPVLSDLLGKKVTLLTLAETFGLLEPSTVRFIESVIQVIDIINSIPLNDGELLIPLGSFKLGQSANGDYDQIDLTDALDEIDLAAAVEGVPASSTVSPSFKEQTKDFADNVGSLDNFSFPFLQNPGSLFGLFVGQDVTLIRWDMPTFKFEFSYTQSVPIYPPLYAHFGGKIGAQIDIGFGYDTYGLRKFFTSEEKNFVDILDGFFVADFDKNGQERPELILYGELFAGASIDLLIAEAGVTGGVYVTVEFDLHDENNDGKLRVSELISNAKIDPRCIFDIHGEIGLFLEAYLEIDLLFLKINKTWRFAEITLFEFDITCPTPELAHTDAGTLYLHMGSRAGDRLEIDTSDGAEHFVIKHISGDATSGETVEITWNGYTETETGVKQIVADGGEQDDIIDLRGVLANVHQIDGGAGNDQIFLGEGVNKDSTSYVDGGAGNDTILAASGGGFVIRGGDGNDIITAGSVALWAEGGAGNDTITGSTLDDTVDGGAGADLIDVGTGNDTVTGGADNDTILLGPGDDEADGGDDNDYILGGTGNDRLNGGSGDDEIIGGSGDDWITGGPGNDRLLGQSGVDVIVGDSATINSPTNITNITGSGNDTIIGGGSGDILFGGDGNDFIFGGTLFANSGTEVFEEDGNDFMDGGTGNDQLFGDDAFGTSVVRDTGISISSFVWYDTNNDGIRQDDEDGLAGVTVQVIENIASQPVAGTAITRSDGSFTILGIKSTKTYFLRFLLPDPSLIFSPQDAGSDDSLDSDVNIATGETDPFTPQPDERISRFAAGAVGPDPVLTVNDVSITEGSQGSKLLTFTAQLTWAAPQRLTVDYATANSTAQGSLVFGFSSGRIIVIPRDFIAANGTLVFEKGESTRNINIEILGDTTWEDRSHEQFDINFSNPSAGLALGTASATGYIIEDDSAPAISIGDYNNAAEPENGTATFTVSLSNPSDEDVTFTWATQVATKQDGTGLAVDAADPGIDFAIQNPTTATIPAGQTEIELTVNLLGDLTDEVNEQFFVSIYNPSSNATIADDRGVGIIYDDDAPVRAVIHQGALNNHSTAVPEGDGGYTPVTLTISLIDPVNPLLLRDSEKTVTVNISAARGTATPEFSDDLSDPLLYGDYAEFATRDDFDNSEDLTNIVFLPGQTSKDITVYVKGDVFAEDGDPTVAGQQNEFFFVNLIGVENAEYGQNHFTIEIVEDDATSGFGGGDGFGAALGSTSYVVAEDAGNLIINIVRTEGTGPGAVVVSTYDSTATSPADYAGGRYLVVFDAGQNFATATIPIVDDMLYEGDEQFKIDLRYLTGEPIGDGTVTITESVATPQYSISDAVADEGDGAILFSITLHLEAGASLANVAELYYHTHNLTAHAGSDYTATSNSAFFAPGAMDGATVIFFAPITDDGVLETAEDLAMHFYDVEVFGTNDDYGEIIDGWGIGQIRDNDFSPIEGYLFLDVDGNGFRDPTDSALEGIDVTITDANGNVTNDTTDALGRYNASVVFGPVQVAVDNDDIPEGYDLTTDNDNQSVEFTGGFSGLSDIGYQPGTIAGVPTDPDDSGSGFTHDTQFGGPGNDEISGGGGDDHIVGGHWQSATNHNVPINTGSYNASLASVPFLGTDFWEVNTAADLAQSGTITGRVWEDLNANHLENGGEPGVPDVLVTLVDAEGSVVAATLTNASGNYTFSDIYKGDYRVRITLPDGAALAQPDQGANNAVDSDFFSASLETTSNITLTAGGTQSNWDAGLVLGGAGSGDLAAGIGFSEVSYSVLENDPEGKATITVTRSSAFEPEGIVYFATDGTAVDGVNYVAVQGLLAFGVGDTEMSFEIPILNAGIPLGESRTVLLSLRLITGQPIANTSVLYIINGTAIEIEDDDTIDGGGDDDIILGDSGNIPGALDAGAMSLSDIEDAGGQGKDVIYGRSGLDFIFGGLDDDIIGGNDGTNIVLGGFGDDRIDAEIDDQTLDGGHGKDAVISTYNGHFELEEFAPGSGELRMINRRDGSVFSTFTLTSIEIAELTGGVLNNNFEITNWSGEAYLDGKGGSNDSIAVENDLDMILRDSNLSLFQALAFLLEHGFLKDAALALSNGSTWHLGSIENATLTGGSGNNLIDASDYSHAVTIEGGAGNDVLIGGIGANRFVFDADSLLGTDKVTGGGGTDTLDFSPTSASNPVTVDLGNTGAVAQFVNGNLFLLLTAEDIEIVIGTDGDDNLTGNSLANTLIGGAGDDDLAGAGGDDYYGYDLDLPWGNDTITENIGGGTDTLDFSSTNTVPVDVNLSAIGPYTVHPTNLSLEFLGDREIEWIIGGDQNDTIVGSATDNAFIDGPGDDSYDGAGGNDRVIAQANANFEVTATTLDYSGQTNLLTDIDRLELKGGNGDNLFSFAGWAGEAHVVGGDAPSGPFTPGFDRISATGDQDFTLTDAALTSPTGLSITSLRIDRWLLTGGASANTITANGFTLGPVEIRGLGGPDILVGGTQNDRIFGGAGNDQISGGPGADYADGGANNDTLIEASDSNFVFGPGTVQIVGGSADTLLNFENMNITGGPGSNLFDVSNWSGGNLTINGAGGVDQVNASADADYTLTNAALTIAPVGGSPITIGLASIEQVLLEGGASDNTFDGTGFTGTTAWLGGEGDDTFLMDAGAGGGTFILLGDDGSDTADFSATSAATNINVDLANGANQPVGTLTVRLLGTTVENVIGGAGDDTLSGNAGDNVFSTGGGSDLIDGLGGTDTLREAHDSDYTMTAATKVAWASGAATFANLERLHITGGASGNNIDLSLFAGDSTVFGLGGDDTIVTGIGNDTIDGGSGNNLLRGSKGDDTYVYDVDALIGKDTIVEINGEGTDTIDFSATDLVSLFIDLGDTSLQTVDTTNGSPNLQIQLSAADGIENVIGGAQDDKFVGNALDNTFTGGEGDDDFDGVAGTNTVRESRDADFTLTDSKLTIDDGATVEEDNFSNIQSAYLEGGSGGNLLDASAFTQGGVTLDGGAGNDTLLGTAKNDVLLGGDGNDTLDAGAGDDSLTGGAGNDVLYGGIGDDDYFFDLSQQLGHDTIYEFLWLTFPGFVPVGGNDTIHGTLGVNLSDSSTQIISSNLALTLPFLNVENQVL